MTMSGLQLQERWGFDDADLGANRLGSSVRNYEDVRELILHVVPEQRFEASPQLQSIIQEDEQWAIYYTSYPFKFLSGERI